ncbi:MAG: methylmalonyl-CoA epimerase [Flavobacteriales bacterium]
MIKKIEHIGIAVENPQKSNEIFEKIFGETSYKSELVESEGVKTYFYQLGESKIELLESVKENSSIEKFIFKRGQGMHHIAFYVDDIHLELDRLTNLGFEAIGEIKQGADNKLICFLHPKTTGGVLIELCQEQDQL